jgi:hypothetical protein
MAGTGVRRVGVSRKYGRHFWCAKACAGSESVLGLIGLDAFFGLSELLLGFLRRNTICGSIPILQGRKGARAPSGAFRCSTDEVFFQ